jgi:nucleotide-binding universal stress UspA family protein
MEYTSIVCGVTGSAHSQKAALEAAHLARKNGARLTYVYAVDITFLRGGITITQNVEKSLERLGNHIVKIAVEIASTLGVTPKKVVGKGHVMEVLKKTILEEKADLLVLGHQKRTFFERALFKGSVENQIGELKRQTGIDVTVVP